MTLFFPAAPGRPGRRSMLRAIAVATVLLLSQAVAHADEVSVSIDNFTFSPAEIVVAPGSTVTWTNADDIPHTVTANDRSFRSKPLDTNDHFSFNFTKPGAYVYFCSLHPHMTGKVIVKAP